MQHVLSPRIYPIDIRPNASGPALSSPQPLDLPPAYDTAEAPAERPLRPRPSPSLSPTLQPLALPQARMARHDIDAAHIPDMQPALATATATTQESARVANLRHEQVLLRRAQLGLTAASRKQAVQELARIPSVAAVDALSVLMSCADADVRRAAHGALSPILVRRVADEGSDDAWDAIRCFRDLALHVQGPARCP